MPISKRASQTACDDPYIALARGFFDDPAAGVKVAGESYGEPTRLGPPVSNPVCAR